MNAFVDIFDASHYRNVRSKPLLEAETLPPWCYTSQAFYDREVERIFRKTWNFLGRADEIPNPGDFMTFDLCGEPLILLRDKDGSIRGYANTCRHRGAKMLEGKGNCRAISCPYHGWVYALNGDLIGTAGMEKTRVFDRARYGLAKISVDTWDGFIFASLDPKPEPLKTFLGNLPAEMAPYNFKDYVCVRRKEYVLECNWKLYLENAMEEYHTPIVHRQSIGAQSMSDVKCTGQWRGLHMPAERTIAVLPEDAARAFPAPAGLTGKPAHGTYFMVIYPQTFFACTQDTMWWLQQFPMGPSRTKVVIGSCFPREIARRGDFQEKVPYYYKRWDKSLPEDNDISEKQQSGLQSSLSAAGRYSFHEPVVHDIAKWVLDRVLDPPRKKAAAPRKTGAKRAPARRPAKRRR